MNASTSERIGRHLRSNVIGYIALFAALTLAPAFAATQKAPKNSVVSKSIKDGKVKSADIGDGQVGAVDLAAGAINWAALQGIPSGFADGTDANSGGTVTSVGSGAGLTGGPITAAGTLALAPCPNGQLLKSTGAGYTCASDTDTNSGGDITSVTPGAGLTGGAQSGDATLSLASCSFGQVLKSNGASYACAADDFALSSFDDASATPSVAGGVTLAIVNYSVATPITNLTGGVTGQRVTVLTADNLASIADGGNFRLSGAWNPDSDDTLTLVRTAGAFWYEVARSAN